MVAISYEMSLCFGEVPSQNQLRTEDRPREETCVVTALDPVLRSSIMCLRGSRSASHRPAGPPITTNTMDLACSEGRVSVSSQD